VHLLAKDKLLKRPLAVDALRGESRAALAPEQHIRRSSVWARGLLVLKERHLLDGLSAHLVTEEAASEAHVLSLRLVPFTALPAVLVHLAVEGDISCLGPLTMLRGIGTLFL
jgi:hypothetical protein